ncbi:TPA: cystine ABC transporter substrate-binding protein, partial [Serratia rubidaea]|nr:cystine ABC transporter substrate-binding protein [Serratia rubidaea]
MLFSKVRRQLALGMMAVALTAGLTANTFAADNLLEQVKHNGTLKVGLEGT